MTKPTTTLSHGSGDQMDNQIYSYFEAKALDALDKCMERACDLAHFKQVKLRIKSGESYWALPAIAKAKLSIKHKLVKGDLTPRFNARYTFETKLGAVDITVNTQGRYIGIVANTADIKKANTGLAFREVDKRLTLANIEG